MSRVAQLIATKNATKYNNSDGTDKEDDEANNISHLYPEVEKSGTQTFGQDSKGQTTGNKIIPIEGTYAEEKNDTQLNFLGNPETAKSTITESPQKLPTMEGNRHGVGDRGFFGKENEDEEDEEDEEDADSDEEDEGGEDGVLMAGGARGSAFNTSSDVGDQILRGFKYMIRINDPKRIYWDLFVMACATWNCISVPLAISLIPNAFDVTGLVVMDFIIDFLFLCDIIINFRTTFINSKGEEIADVKIIAINYLKFKFWIDFLSCFPFDYAARLFTDSDTKFFDILGLLKLVRIARLTKIINFLNVTESVKMTLKLIKLIFFLCLYLHTLACTWWYIVATNEDYVPPQDYMYVQTDLFDQTLGYKYFCSVYMALAMLNGGEPGPRTTEQLLFVCAFILIGAIITANIFGTMAVIVEALNRKESKFQQKLDLANTSMKNMSLPDEIQRKVINYIFYTQSSLDQQTELKSFLRLLSPSLKMEIYRHMFGGILRMSSVFKGQSHGVIDFVIEHLESMAFLPEDKIINQGDTADKMYFINKGDCQVIMKTHRNNNQLILPKLTKGSFFGELALINGGKRSATVKALNYANTAAMSEDKFKELKKEYPNIVENLKQKAKEYCDPVSVFIKDSMKYLDLFESCSEEVVSNVFLTMKVEEYNPGTVIQKRHKVPNDILFVANGQIDLKVEMDEGKEALLDRLGPGSIINLYGAINRAPVKFKAICQTYVSVFLLEADKLKKLIQKDDSLREGYNFLKQKWTLQAPMCDYTTVLPQRSVKQVFEDCIARHRIIKQKQEQVGKKFANLLENVKKQQLEEKRMALLDLLKTEKTAMASGTITPDLAAAPMDASNYGGRGGENVTDLRREVGGLRADISDMKEYLITLVKNIRK